MNNIDLSSMTLDQLLPHSAPMILVDELVSYQTDNLVTQVNITSSSPYFDEQLSGVPNYVGIEYMAQSVAALAGIEAKNRDDIVRIGFLLGSRKLNMEIPFYRLGQNYQVNVTRLYQEESGLAVFECHILHDDQIVASANVNVFQPLDTQAYLTESHTDSGEK